MTKKRIISQQWLTGEAFYDGKVQCPCGKEPYLHFNGGELDRTECNCGRVYLSDAPLIQIWVEE